MGIQNLKLHDAHLFSWECFATGANSCVLQGAMFGLADERTLMTLKSSLASLSSRRKLRA